MDPDKGVNKLSEHLPRVFLIEVSSWLDLHVVPQIGKGVEWEDYGNVLLLIDNDILDLTNPLDADELVHDLDLILYIFEQVLFPDFLDAHVF